MKTKKELEELVELIEWKLSTKKSCACLTCRVNVSLFTAELETVKWPLGRRNARFNLLVRSLRRERANATKHHVAHAE
jgi:hypothetical protein